MKSRVSEREPVVKRVYLVAHPSFPPVRSLCAQPRQFWRRRDFPTQGSCSGQLGAVRRLLLLHLRSHGLYASRERASHPSHASGKFALMTIDTVTERAASAPPPRLATTTAPTRG